MKTQNSSRLGILALGFFFLSFLGNSSFTLQTPPGCNEGHARGVAMANETFRDCIHGPIAGPYANGDISISVNAIPGPSGCTYEVIAFVCPPCRPNHPCIAIPCRVLSSATIDANFNVTGVYCLQ